MQYSHAKAGALGALALFWSLAGCSGNGGGSGPAPTYQVGGTVEGLGAGGTLVVQLNGGNDLTITGDGTFEFPVQLTAGDSYSVTVLSGPGDYVTVQNGIGIAAADVADITIACTSWRIPTDEDDSESPTASDAQDPAVAINALGNAIVVFSQYNDRDESQIFVSALNDGVWHRPTDLTDHISPLGEYAYAPKVAIAPTGDAIVVWVQYDGSRNRIFVATRDGGTWTYPADLNAAISNGTTDAGDCSVAMLPNGDAVVAWEQFDGSFYQIYKSERHAGVWSHPANLADNISPNGQNAQDPFVATAGNGEIVIAYQGRREHLTRIDESTVTNALARLLRGGDRFVTVLAANGERRATREGNRDISRFAATLGERGLAVREFALGTIDDVPANTAVLVIASPRSAYSLRELEAIERYVAALERERARLLSLLDMGLLFLRPLRSGETGRDLRT